MTLEADIDRIKVQEAELRFKAFGENESWVLGEMMRAQAAIRNLPLIIDIRIGQRPLFYAALPGTTADNPDWAQRKINTVLRFHAASYRVGLEHRRRNAPFDETRGVEPLRYAIAGGGFPIHIVGAGVVGAIAVSGIPQREDHGFVVECLCQYLHADPAALALPPETA